MEIRFKDAELECRENGELKVGGYINVTERDSEILFSENREKWFIEKMQKGVFQRALEKASEVPLLFQHNWEKRLATTLDQSLSLREDSIGLRFDATINNSEVYDLVQNGEINSCSFGFIARNQTFEPVDSKLEKRYVTDIELLEVSLVNKPAYVGSLVEARAYEEALAEENKKKKKDDKESSEKNPNEKKEKEEVQNKEQDKEKPADAKEDKKDKKDKSDDSDKKPEDKSDEKNKSEDKKKKDEKREDDNSKSYKDEELKRAISEILDKVIEEKNLALTKKESEEQFIQDSIQSEKQFSNEIVNELEGEAMRCSADVVQLRLDLLKLKNVKKEYK